ncbi:hypothetical protein KO495_13735 [Colwellia sp. D2M02]|uniref:hypothetical protein n=1 Tax=Colwellia sp. D2M02 TaxID=2841562 RepID=UPI001C08CC15|nr:hypothetical protein [Colwellia sp. D2M02]MBU2894371.1 hypothetical protein [Colwellia sp. D2M02]
MELAKKNVMFLHDSIEHSTDSTLESSFKHCFISSVWTQSRLVSSLLDQVGLAYHRVFHNEALELFLVLINTQSPDFDSFASYGIEEFSLLNKDLLTIQSKLISSMDLFVVEAFNNTQKQKSSTNFFNKLLGKHHEWKSCAKARFEQVICPILEQKLINKTL